MGIRLMIIKLGRYNEIRELLMGNRTTGSQAQVSYQDGFRATSVTRAAVHMGVKEMGMQTGYRGAVKNRFSNLTKEQEGVKNGFSDLTEEQEGQDWSRKDVMNRCQA